MSPEEREARLRIVRERTIEYARTEPPSDWCGLYILDEAGEPKPCYDTLEWGRWMETADRRVCQDYDEGDGEKQIRISTVFLGLDHNFHGNRPLLYETMVFIKDDTINPILGRALPREMDGTTRRYSTRDEAVIGHQEVCELVMKAIRESEKDRPHR
jgi:hypothetical protein